MSYFQRAFCMWFVVFMGIFVGANFAGLVLHGSKVHGFGFPFAIARWIEIGDWRGEVEFYPFSIFTNTVICATISAVLALICGASRARAKGRLSGQLPLPSDCASTCEETGYETDSRVP